MLNRMLVRALVIVCLAVCVTVIPGCQSAERERETEMQEQPVSTDDMLSEAQKELAKLREQAAGREPALVKASPVSPEEMSEADRRLAEYKEDLTLEENRKRYLAASLYKQGLNAYAAGELEEAMESFKRAWDNDPAHVEAQEKYWELKALLQTDRVGVAKTEWEHAQEMEKARVQQIKMQMQNDFEVAVKLFEAESYEDAIRRFESVIDRIQYSPLEIDDGGFKERAEKYIELAEAQKRIRDARDSKERQQRAMELIEQKEQQRQETNEARVETWMNEAEDAYATERYGLCLTKLRLVLQYDPQNNRAYSLLDRTKRTMERMAIDKVREKELRAWKDQIIEMYETLIPYNDPDFVIFPAMDVWDERGAIAGLAGDVGGSEGRKKVFRILSETVINDLNFEQRSAEEMIQTLEAATGLNFIVDESVRRDEKLKNINLSLQTATAAQILKVLKNLYGVDYNVEEAESYGRENDENEAWIYVSTASASNGVYELQKYDVADLVHPVQDFPGKPIILDAAARRQSFDDFTMGITTEDFTVKTPTTNDLIKLIKQTIEPSSWNTGNQNSEKPTITAVGDNTLLVRASKRVQQQVGPLLDNIRQSNGVMIAVETAYVEINDDFLMNVLSDFRGLGGTGAGQPGNLPNGLQGIGPAWQRSEVGSGQSFLTAADGTRILGANGQPIPLPYGYFPKGPFFPRFDPRVGGFVLEDVNNLVGGGPLGVSPSVGHRTGSMDNQINAFNGARPAAGIFFNDNTDGDIRFRTENTFDTQLGGILPNHPLTATGGLALQMTFLDDTQVNYLFHTIRKDDRVKIVNSPRLILWNTQRANISLVRETSYIEDYDVQIATGTHIFDPIISKVRDGVVLDVRPVASPDRKWVTMELRPTLAKLNPRMRHMITVTGDKPEANPPFVDLPQLTVQSVNTSVAMPTGGSLLVGGLKNILEQDFESSAPFFRNIPVLNFFFRQKGKTLQKKRLVVIVRARVIVLEETRERQQGSAAIR